MADYNLVEVSDLDALENPSNSDVLPIQDGSGLKKITYQNLKTKVVSDEATARQNADNLKLNKPTGGNGTSGQMLLTNGDGSTQWASPDDALTTTGKAADAKATGDAIKAVDANLAAPYSTSATYAVGDYCTKDGVLKRCNTAITTAEAWNSAHWDDAKLGGDVSDLNYALSLVDAELFGDVDATFPLTFENGTYENVTIGSTLVKYHGGNYDATRKVIKTTVFNAPCDVVLKAKSGYLFSVYTASNGIITGSYAQIAEYHLASGQQYGIILHATNGTDDISAVPVSSIIDIEYVNSAEAVAADLNALEDVISYGEIKENLLLNSYNVINLLVGTTGYWSTAGTSYMIPVPPNAKTITIKAGTQLAVLSMLKTRNYQSGSSVVYATGTRRNVIQANDTQTYTLPFDCTYVNLLYTANNLDYTPSEAYFTEEGVVEKSIGLTTDKWIDSYCVMASTWSSGYHLIQGQIMAASNVLSATEYIEIPNGMKMLEIPLIVTFDTTYQNYGICLYDADGNPLLGRGISALPNRVGNNYVVWVKMYLPKEAKYFRTTYWSASFREGKEEYIPVFTYNLLDDYPEGYEPITHELPVDTYMQNSIRRARQLTDIKWTPRVNIPRYSMMNGSDVHFLDWFYADHEYTGIPYSGAGGQEANWTSIKEWGYSHNWVGQHIPIEAFVTAARYPNSIFSETTGQTQPDYDSSPFGDVCTALVNYAVDGATPLRGITNFFTKEGKDEFRTSHVKLKNWTDLNSVCIGDFLYDPTHVTMITDLLRDENGNVTHIEQSEATTIGNGNNAVLGTEYGGLARRKMFDVDSFKERYGEYYLFRKTTFFGIGYTPSDYVDTGNEGQRKKIVDYPCIPYLGEGAVYKVGYIHNSKICIGATGFTSLVVLKDDEAFDTFDVTGLTEVSVGFTDVGSYEAYLTNGNHRTLSCHWTVEA